MYIIKLLSYFLYQVPCTVKINKNKLSAIYSNNLIKLVNILFIHFLGTQYDTMECSKLNVLNKFD